MIVNLSLKRLGNSGDVVIQTLDKAKRIAKKVYDLSDVITGIQGGEGYPISVGIYFPTPKPMLDAAIKYAEQVRDQNSRLSPPGNYWSPMGRGVETNELKDLIADKLLKENQLSVDPENEIMLTAGISTGITIVPQLLVDPGDEVLVIQPDYVRLRNPVGWGAKVVPVPLKERKGVIDETRWYFDPKELESRITEKSKLIMFCNLNNPTGYVYSKEDLNAMADLAKKHDLFVFCNECYERFDLRDDFYKTLVTNSISGVPGMKERTFISQGITKAYETEGNEHCAWLVGPAEYISVLEWLLFAFCYRSITALGGYIGIAALTSPFREDYIRQQFKIYKQNRDLLWETLNKFSWIECGKPMGGTFIFPDITKSGMDDQSFGKFLYERGVGPSIGRAWGPKYGLGHERFAYCSPPEYHQIMCSKLEEALKYYEVVNKDIIIK